MITCLISRIGIQNVERRCNQFGLDRHRGRAGSFASIQRPLYCVDSCGFETSQLNIRPQFYWLRRETPSNGSHKKFDSFWRHVQIFEDFIWLTTFEKGKLITMPGKNTYVRKGNFKCI